MLKFKVIRNLEHIWRHSLRSLHHECLECWSVQSWVCIPDEQFMLPWDWLIFIWPWAIKAWSSWLPSTVLKIYIDPWTWDMLTLLHTIAVSWLLVLGSLVWAQTFQTKCRIRTRMGSLIFLSLHHWHLTGNAWGLVGKTTLSWVSVGD